ncbi:hypothetical protein BJV74DRAFT_343588 [Russula compacta]|nr:hypothetical protein BJV74DRAFT_343588 [Russula compacta]
MDPLALSCMLLRSRSCGCVQLTNGDHKHCGLPHGDVPVDLGPNCMDNIYHSYKPEIVLITVRCHRGREYMHIAYINMWDLDDFYPRKSTNAVPRRKTWTLCKMNFSQKKGKEKRQRCFLFLHNTHDLVTVTRPASAQNMTACLSIRIVVCSQNTTINLLIIGGVCLR